MNIYIFHLLEINSTPYRVIHIWQKISEYDIVLLFASYDNKKIDEFAEGYTYNTSLFELNCYFRRVCLPT